MKTYSIAIGWKFVIKIFALKNFKINIHQNVSRAFNILHYYNNRNTSSVWLYQKKKSLFNRKLYILHGPNDVMMSNQK